MLQRLLLSLLMLVALPSYALAQDEANLPDAPPTAQAADEEFFLPAAPPESERAAADEQNPTVPPVQERALWHFFSNVPARSDFSKNDLAGWEVWARPANDSDGFVPADQLPEPAASIAKLLSKTYPALEAVRYKVEETPNGIKIHLGLPADTEEAESLGKLQREGNCDAFNSTGNFSPSLLTSLGEVNTRAFLELLGRISLYQHKHLAKLENDEVLEVERAYFRQSTNTPADWWYEVNLRVVKRTIQDDRVSLRQ